jgi:hypothetical protein
MKRDILAMATALGVIPLVCGVVILAMYGALVVMRRVMRVGYIAQQNLLDNYYECWWCIGMR